MPPLSNCLSSDRLKEILEGYSQLTIGLVGDLFLDRYLIIDPESNETSIETGLEAYQITRVNNQPGALGTVMNNLASLGVGRLIPVTVVGEDGHGYDLLKSIQNLPVDTQYVIQSSDRLTPTYTKPMRQRPDGSQEELNRIDVRTFAELEHATTQLVVSHLEQLFQEADGIIVLDQINETNWGVVNSEVRNKLSKLCEQFPEKLVFVDSRTHLHEFSCGILKGNEAEIRTSGKPNGSIEDAMRRIHLTTGWPVYCTRGKDGIMVTTATGGTVLVPGIPARGPVDIVGAGDSATSGILTSLLAGADPVEAAIVGNLVASVTVQKLGTTGTATQTEVLASFKESSGD